MKNVDHFSMARRLVNDPNVINSLRVLQQERFAALNQVAQEAQARASATSAASIGMSVPVPSAFPPQLVFVFVSISICLFTIIFRPNSIKLPCAVCQCYPLSASRMPKLQPSSTFCSRIPSLQFVKSIFSRFTHTILEPSTVHWSWTFRLRSP